MRPHAQSNLIDKLMFFVPISFRNIRISRQRSLQMKTKTKMHQILRTMMKMMTMMMTTMVPLWRGRLSWGG